MCPTIAGVAVERRGDASRLGGLPRAGCGGGRAGWHAHPALAVDDLDATREVAARLGCHPLRGVARYEDAYLLTYLRGPCGIVIMLAEELGWY